MWQKYLSRYSLFVVMHRLPEIVAAADSPLSKIGQMTVLSTGDSSGASKITSDILNIANQGLVMVKGLTGIDITSYLHKDNGDSEKAKT